MTIWILSISTYSGIVPGAYHYRGRMRPRHEFNDNNLYELYRPMSAKEAREENKRSYEMYGCSAWMKPGDLTNGFLTMKDLRLAAIKKFKEVCAGDPRSDILMEGSQACLDPQLCLCGPMDVILIANKLWREFRYKLDGWEIKENYPESERVSEEWNRLIPYESSVR
jgi:hypothetical protein